MPITVKVVSEADYAEWLNSAKEEYADLSPGAGPRDVSQPIRLASN
jgi:heme/copper-type cytochrome/quinol oxidase subunit 2